MPKKEQPEYHGKGRMLGEYKCYYCNRYWKSAHSSAHVPQKCHGCFETYVYPHKQTQDWTKPNKDMNKDEPKGK